MTTIILTIIGILLAAAAALMVIFYGGDAFNSGNTGAAAATILNSGTNVLSAVQMHRSDTGIPTFTNMTVGATHDRARFAEFLTKEGPGGRYLNEAPALPAGLSHGFTTVRAQYRITGISSDVCLRINKDLKLQPNSDTVPLANLPNDAKTGCVGSGSVFVYVAGT